jgi:ABC-2 type transport system ATP-binding protein
VSDFAIETFGLSKTYGNVHALDNVGLAIPAGSVCALIGRNGAGKTTAIRTLLGMVHPTSGTGRVLGLAIDDPHASVEIRRRAAFVEPAALYSWMTIGELLKFARGCYPDWNRQREVAGVFALGLPLDRKISALSKGMRTKLAVLLALAREAEVLFFDEPTDGLDPVVREQVLRSLVAINAARGATLLVSSHQLSELEDIANWLCLVDRGRLVLAGEMDDIRASHHRIDVRWPDAAGAMMGAVPGVISVSRNGIFGTLIVAGDVAEPLRVVGASIVKQERATLKEIVLAYAAPDVGNTEWVMQGMRDAVA